MDYVTCLQQLLRPLGVYQLQPESLSGGEIWAAGTAMDQASAQIEYHLRQSLALTAQDDGLARLEQLLGVRPVSPDLKFRRQALAALLQIGDRGFTLQAINAAIAGCGIAAQVQEADEAQSVIVRFPLRADTPDELQRLKQIVERIVPCHLKIIYQQRYLLWREVALSGWTWGALGAWTWRQLTASIPGVNC